MMISTQHVLQRYMSSAANWDSTEEESAQEFELWLEAVRNGIER